jgi:hypothetical protein
MAEAKTQLRRELRIFCLCGQKMRVMPSMHGRPGKCVACRQKIRIPRLDEVPAGTTEFYLRDHPEFLRRAAPAQGRGNGGDSGPNPMARGGEPLPEQDLVLGDDGDTAQSPPIDPLRPLQVLCSYDSKIAERLHVLREAGQDTDRAREKTALMGYRALVRNARHDLDEQLRQRLHEVTDQLSDMRERIARASLALRVGDLSYEEYVDTVTPLRIRRDRLERRRVNLTGWLHTADPFLAGGFVDLNYDEIPVTALEVGFPVETGEAPTVLQTRLNALRDALTEREEGRRKLEGLQRMQREDQVDKSQARRLLHDADARVQRARVHLEFERGRVEQLIQDCESDTRAIRAHLEEAQASVEQGLLTPGHYGEVEQRMLQAQGDLNESKVLGRKGVQAERPDEVPVVKNTFIKRMNKRSQDNSLVDNGVGWLSALALSATAFLPFAAGQEGSNLANFTLLMLVLLLGSVLFVCAALIPNRAARGLTLLGIWVAVTVLSVLALQLARYSLAPVGGLMRTNPQWFLTLGMLLYAAAMVGMGLSASVTLAKVERLRSLPLAAALIAVACISLIVTNGAGLLVSRPELMPPQAAASAQQPGVYDVAVPVTNGGNRTYWLGGSPERVPEPVRFVLQKKVGEALSWEDYTLRQEAPRPGQTLGSILTSDRFPVIEVQPGETKMVRYALEPGTYRARLIASGYGGAYERNQEFNLPEFAEPVPAPEPERGPEQGGAPPAPEPPGVMTANAKLQGVLDSNGQDPLFSLMIETSDGAIINQRVGLGGAVMGQWYASEYSPASQNLTISDGKQLLVLERGQTVTFEYTEKAETAEGEDFTQPQ